MFAEDILVYGLYKRSCDTYIWKTIDDILVGDLDVPTNEDQEKLPELLEEPI